MRQVNEEDPECSHNFIVNHMALGNEQVKPQPGTRNTNPEERNTKQGTQPQTPQPATRCSRNFIVNHMALGNEQVHPQPSASSLLFSSLEFHKVYEP